MRSARGVELQFADSRGAAPSARPEFPKAAVGKTATDEQRSARIRLPRSIIHSSVAKAPLSKENQPFAAGFPKRCPTCHPHRVRSIGDWIARELCFDVLHRQFVSTKTKPQRGIFHKRRVQFFLRLRRRVRP